MGWVITERGFHVDDVSMEGGWLSHDECNRKGLIDNNDGFEHERNVGCNKNDNSNDKGGFGLALH